jgi:Uma2 family endonuclease
MPVVVLDPEVAEKLLAERSSEPRRRRDEVWEGVTFIMPEPDLEHVDLATFFVWAFRSVFDPADGHRVQGPTNISDCERDWTQNYRAPDISLFLSGNPAQDRRTHWLGGPDLAIEIVSPDDRSRDKLDFYAHVGTREVLVVDRHPWQLELYQLRRGRMRLKRTINPGDSEVLASSVVPMAFQLVRGRPRPKVKITHAGTGQEWMG